MKSITGVEVDVDQWRDNWRSWVEPLTTIRPVEGDAFKIGKVACWFEPEPVIEEGAAVSDEDTRGTFKFEPGIEGGGSHTILGLRIAQLSKGPEIMISTNLGGGFPPWNLSEEQMDFVGDAISTIKEMYDA